MTMFLVQLAMASVLGGLFGRSDFAPVIPPASASEPAVASETRAPAAPRKTNLASLGVKLTAPASTLVDTRTGAPLFVHGHERKVPIASITKLMTALVLLDEAPDWDAELSIEASDHAYQGIAYLKAGDRLTVRQAFETMLVGSANNAAMALSRVHGGQEAFVARMNAKATALGLAHTSFADPTGYLPENASTPSDVARLAWHAFSRPEIREAVERRELSFRTAQGGERRVPSTNLLLGGMLDQDGGTIIGGKTGYTEEAGYTLVVRAKRGTGDAIGVVLGSANAEARFQDMKGLLDWGFRTFAWE